MAELAKVFEDRQSPGDWRVEWFDDNGGCEVAIFSCRNARERAIRYADRQYGSFEEISLTPYPVSRASRRSAGYYVAEGRIEVRHAEQSIRNSSATTQAVHFRG